MAASRLSSLAVATAMAASYTTVNNCAYADSPFRFPSFASSAAPEAPPSDRSGHGEDPQSAPAVEVSKGGFDPEALERGAKALREINNSPHSKQVFLNIFFLVLYSNGNLTILFIFDNFVFYLALKVFDVMRKQEQTRLAELDAEKANFEAIQAHADIVSSTMLINCFGLKIKRISLLS